MKYAVLITYSSGYRTGTTVKAGSVLQAWEKTQSFLRIANAQSIQIAELSACDFENLEEIYH